MIIGSGSLLSIYGRPAVLHPEGTAAWGWSGSAKERFRGNLLETCLYGADPFAAPQPGDAPDSFQQVFEFQTDINPKRG